MNLRKDHYRHNPSIACTRICEAWRISLASLGCIECARQTCTRYSASLREACKSLQGTKCLALTQLPAMDALAQITMKGASKCDKHCELQHSVSQSKVERMLRCQYLLTACPFQIPQMLFQLVVRLLACQRAVDQHRVSSLRAHDGSTPQTSTIRARARFEVIRSVNCSCGVCKSFRNEVGQENPPNLSI